MSKKHRLESNLTNAPIDLAYAKRRGQAVRRGVRREVRRGLLIEHVRRNGRRRTRVIDLPHRLTLVGAVSWPRDPGVTTASGTPRYVYAFSSRDGLISGQGVIDVAPEDITVTSGDNSKLLGDYLVTSYGPPLGPPSANLSRTVRDKNPTSICLTWLGTNTNQWEGVPEVLFMPMSPDRPLAVGVSASAHSNKLVQITVAESVIRQSTGFGLVARDRKKPLITAPQLYAFAPEPTADWGSWGVVLAFPGVDYSDEQYDHGLKGLVFTYINADVVLGTEVEGSSSSVVAFHLPDVPQFQQGVWVDAGEDHDDDPITGRLPSFIHGDVVAPTNDVGQQVGEFVYFGVYHGGVDVVVDGENEVDYLTTLFFADSAGNFQILRSTSAKDELPDVPVNVPPYSDKPLYNYMTAFYAAGLVWGVCIVYRGSGQLKNGTTGLTNRVYGLSVLVANEFGIVEDGVPAGTELFDLGDDVESLTWGLTVLGGDYRTASQSVFACHLNTTDHFGFTFAVIQNGRRRLAKWDTLDGFGVWDFDYEDFAGADGSVPAVNCYRRVSVAEDSSGGQKVVGDPGFVVSHNGGSEGGATFVVTAGKSRRVAPVGAAGGLPTGNVLSVKGSTSDAYQVYTAPEEG